MSDVVADFVWLVDGTWSLTRVVVVDFFDGFSGGLFPLLFNVGVGVVFSFCFSTFVCDTLLSRTLSAANRPDADASLLVVFRVYVRMSLGR